MIACEFDVAEKTIYEWVQTYPEFGKSLARARQEAQRFFEKKAIDNMGNRDFNPKLWEIQVRCRFPETYRDTTRLDIHQTITVDGLSPDVLSRLQTYAPRDGQTN